MEKPCHVPKAVCTLQGHIAGMLGCDGKALGDMANPLWCCFARSRPVLGLTSVNKQQQPGGAVHGAETKDLSSTVGTAFPLLLYEPISKFRTIFSSLV